MNQLPHIASRIFNTPLMILPAKLDAIIAGLGPRLGLTPEAAPPEALRTQRGEYKAPGYDTVEGVGVIDVFGVLAHRGRLEADSSYVLGYQDIARRLDAALQDEAVHSVMMVFDTPGGEVSGAFDLAERIYQARGTKPITAVVSDMAASAGYLLASAADEIVVSPTGYVGSIGVVMRHVDISQALQKEGVRVTHIFAGQHKVDGTHFEPLPPDVRFKLQAEVDALRLEFAQAVGRYRGMGTDQLMRTEADVYRGSQAIQMGLANYVEGTDETIARLIKNNAKNGIFQEKKSMNPNPPASASGAAGFTQADLDRVRQDALAEGIKQGVAAEQARASAILNHPEAKGRTPTAIAAVSMGLSIEQAAAMLAAAPTVAAALPSAGSEFAREMAKYNAHVGPDQAQKPEAKVGSPDFAQELWASIRAQKAKAARKPWEAA